MCRARAVTGILAILATLACGNPGDASRDDAPANAVPHPGPWRAGGPYVQLLGTVQDGGLPHAALRTRLVAEGFDDDLVQRVINELEGADFARFAASGVSKDEMERCRQRTAAIIERIQGSRTTT